MPEPEPGVLDEAWRELDREWEDEDAHERFLRRAAALGALGEAGRLYREVREGEAAGERADRAKAQIDRILGLALTQLTPAERTSPARRLPLLLLALLVSGAMVITALYAWLRPG